MDSFFYYVSDRAMLTKMGIFYLVSVPIGGFILAGGETGHLAHGMGMEVVGFVVSTLCILLAGRIFGEPASLLGAAVLLGFVRSVVNFVAGAYLFAIVIDLMAPNVIVIIVFLIWNFVLNIMALTNIFGCSGLVAFVISFVAGVIQRFVTMAIGIRE